MDPRGTTPSVVGAFGWRSAAWALLLTSQLACGGQARSAQSGAPEPGSRGEGCVTAGPEVCFNALDDNCNGPIDEGCGLESGFVQFVIAWSEEDADVDLVVVDPNGDPAVVGKELGSGLTKDRDCPGSDDACAGRNIENVFSLAGEGSLRGRYLVKVRLERWDGLSQGVPVNFSARLGAKTFASRFELAQEKQERRFELSL